MNKLVLLIGGTVAIGLIGALVQNQYNESVTAHEKVVLERDYLKRDKEHLIRVLKSLSNASFYHSYDTSTEKNVVCVHIQTNDVYVDPDGGISCDAVVGEYDTEEMAQFMADKLTNEHNIMGKVQ